MTMRKITPESSLKSTRGGFQSPISFTVPLIPPSVNDYVRHTRAGSHYRTAEAKAWDEAVAVCAMGRRIRAQAYCVSVVVYLGKGDRGDADNFLKCVCDGAVKAGVIDTDAKVAEVHLTKRRDRGNPRTEIMIAGMSKL